MGWIRQIEELRRRGIRIEGVDYELASECRITGYMDYEEGAIICHPYSLDRDENGLYRYLLRIKYAIPNPLEKSFDIQEYIASTSRRGYYFKSGINGELISLMSLALQCRFHLISSAQGIGTSGPIYKTLYPFFYLRTSALNHPTIFDQKNRSRNFTQEVPPFLDAIRKLDASIHLPFALASNHYARALREVGVDTEMVFIRLVSAIEALLGVGRDGATSALYGLDFDSAFIGANLTEDQRAELREVLMASDGPITFQRIKSRFIEFIDKYSKGYFKGGKTRARLAKISKADLPKVLSAIYNARSAYLHSGESMFLSRISPQFPNWDIEPGLDSYVDGRRLRHQDKLPYAHWFENLVRACLLNFMKNNLSTAKEA